MFSLKYIREPEKIVYSLNHFTENTYNLVSHRKNKNMKILAAFIKEIGK